MQHLLGQLALVEGVIAQVGAELRCVFREAIGRYDRRKIEARLACGFAGLQFEQVDAADQVFELLHAEFCHQLPHLFGHEAEEIDHHLRQADEVLAAQHLVLRGHAGRAIVQVTDAQVLAAERDQRCRAETETLGAKQRGLDDIETGLEAAVGLQPHLVAQIVATQYLVRFRQTQFPGAAGILDRGQRARAGAAVIAGDRDQVGIGLGDAGRDRADAGLGHQLDRHQRARIDLLQVEDQLREILDRIDVVMRRRRNQADAGLARSAASRSSR